MIDKIQKPGLSESLGQSAGKALDILDLFTLENPELAVTDAAQALNITPSTASRLLATLESRGYVMRDAKRGKYRLGLASLALGGLAANQMDLRNIAWPYIKELSEETDCTANLGVKFRDKVLYLISILGQTSKDMRGKDVTGRQLPLYCTAMGKVLLAALPDNLLEEEVANLKLRSRTPNTIVAPKKLLEEVWQVRQQGYALDREEDMLGSNCIAVPIRSDNNIIAAVSVSGPAYRYPIGQIEKLGELLLRCAYQLSMALRP